MFDGNFYQGAPDPNADPAAFARQQSMAKALQQQGATPSKGTAGYATQLASALAGGYKMNQLRDAANASSLLNGGPGVQTPIQQGIGWLRGLGSA